MLKRTRSPRLLLGTAAFAGITTVAAVTGASAATLTTVTTATGSAFGIKSAGAITAATLALVPVNVPETPTVTTTNSSVASTKTVASVYVPLACALFTPTCAVNAHTLKASTKNTAGASGASVSSAQLKDISLLFDLINVKALHAECRADKTGLTMSSALVVGPTPPNLPVAVPLPASPVSQANTVIPIGSGTTVVGTVTLNEQIDTSTATKNSGEVNAIHINLPAGSALSLTGLDVIVGHAACSAS